MYLSFILLTNLAIFVNFIYTQTNTSNNTYYCQPEDRSKMCTMEYIGVCGWYSKNVNCLVYPCAITSGTFCQACGIKDVEYVTMGECPKANSKENNINETYTNNTSITYTLPYTCKDQDRTRNCSMSTSNYMVCANNANCEGANCKFQLKPCDACLIPSVDRLTATENCFAIFRSVNLLYLIVFILFITFI